MLAGTERSNAGDGVALLALPSKGGVYGIRTVTGPVLSMHARADEAEASTPCPGWTSRDPPGPPVSSRRPFPETPVSADVLRQDPRFCRRRDPRDGLRCQPYRLSDSEWEAVNAYSPR